MSKKRKRKRKEQIQIQKYRYFVNTQGTSEEYVTLLYIAVLINHPIGTITKFDCENCLGTESSFSLITNVDTKFIHGY